MPVIFVVEPLSAPCLRSSHKVDPYAGRDVRVSVQGDGAGYEMHELTNDSPPRKLLQERLFTRTRGGSYIDVLFLLASGRVTVGQSRANQET